MISNDLIPSKFWSRCFDEKLEKHKTYDALITDLKENRIMEGLDMFTQEYEKDLQIDLYKWLCSVSQQLSTKYPQVPLISSGDTNGDEKKNNSSFEKLFFAKDFWTSLKNIEDSNEYHYGLESVLDDIIQVDAKQSSIEVIDCI